ncbi:MAG: SAM-dependent chlorinase/fluorinase [Actinobacteria bacterium]|nr:SAM-dependent chlorinase/fluorinase [Actinomycetota bacterium]
MDRPICFFSDYGYTDDFAGVCRAVIARLAPDVRVIDVTHGLPERDVLAGAVVLRNTLPYMPDKAVILAVVDPGVGGPRRPVAMRSHGDRLFVGPDNGLLMHAVALDGGVSSAYELSNQELWLSPLSATFHGRDIFAPVAARLAAGLDLESCGAPVDPETLDRIDLPEPRRHRDGLTATAVLVDRFGNVALNLRARDLEKAHLIETVELIAGNERYLARVARTFASVRTSDIVVLIDSYGQASVAVNAGSAAEVLGLDAGDEIRIRRLG